MKKTFTLNEVISIIDDIHKSDFKNPIKEYADFNNFNEEQAVSHATDKYVSEMSWRK